MKKKKKSPIAFRDHRGGANPYAKSLTFEAMWAIHPIKPVFMTHRGRSLAVLDIGPTIS